MSRFVDRSVLSSETLPDGRIRHQLADRRTLTIPPAPTHRMEYLSTWVDSEPGETYDINIAPIGPCSATGYCEVWNYDSGKVRSYAYDKIVRLVSLVDGQVYERAGEVLCHQFGGTMLWPLDSYRFPVAAVGEAYYEDALRSIVPVVAGATAEHRCTAVLVPYDTNPHDAEAVSVEVDGQRVGHLSRDDARSHRAALAARGMPGATVSCPAMIAGGGAVDGQPQHFAVLLDLEL